MAGMNATPLPGGRDLDRDRNGPRGRNGRRSAGNLGYGLAGTDPDVSDDGAPSAHSPALPSRGSSSGRTGAAYVPFVSGRHARLLLEPLPSRLSAAVDGLPLRRSARSPQPALSAESHASNRRLAEALVKTTDHSALDPLVRNALTRDPGLAVAEFLDLVDQTRRLDPASGDRVADLVHRAIRDVLPGALHDGGLRNRFGQKAVFLSGERNLDALTAPSRGSARWLKRLADGTKGAAGEKVADLDRSKGNPAGLYGKQGSEGDKASPAPIINQEKDRIANILADAPAKFEIVDNPDADGSPVLYERPGLANETVREHDDLIEEIATKHSVDPDLVRAVMWSENARGHKGIFNEIADWIEYSDSPRPMNINKHLWSGLISEKPSALYDPRKNIEAATILLKRIRDRIDDPTPAKIGSVWIFTGRERVNDFGAYIQRIYDEKPWKSDED